MNEIFELYNQYIEKVKALYNTNPTVPDFIEKCIGFDKEFLEKLEKIEPSDVNGKYAKCFIIDHFEKNKIPNPQKKVEEFKEAYGNTRIQDKNAGGISSELYNNLFNFKSNLEKISKMPESEAKKELEKCNAETSMLDLKLDGISAGSDYCNSPVFNLSNSPSRTLS